MAVFLSIYLSSPAADLPADWTGRLNVYVLKKNPRPADVSLPGGEIELIWFSNQGQ